MSFSAQPPGGLESKEPVAIIGLSCVWPGAIGAEAYWALIKNKDSAITDIPPDRWNIADYYDPDPKARDKTYGRRGGFIAPVAFEPLKYGIAPSDLPATDTTQLLGLVLARAALEDAGYPAGGTYDHERTAVILGVTGALKMVVSLGSRLAHPMIRKALAKSGVDEETSQEVLDRFADSFTPWQESSFPGLLGNVSAGRIANRLDLGGANFVTDAACASSLAAIRLAVEELRGGRADLAISGGLDTFSDPFMYACFSKTPALSPQGCLKPYDQKGDGTVLGEGLGLVVLKRLSRARADGDRIYAVIKGIGASSDGRGAAIFAPTPKGQTRALLRAYEEAGTPPETIELLEGHGTGTAVGDSVELQALTEVYTPHRPEAQAAPWCALGSIKAQIGHAKAAAGAAGLIKAVLALHHKVIPPTLTGDHPLPQLDSAHTPFHLNRQPRPWLKKSTHKRRAGVSSFGFGGSNFHCVLEEETSEKQAPDWDGRVMIWAWSAEDPQELGRHMAKDWPVISGAMKSGETWPAALAGAKISTAEFNPRHPYRLVWAAAKGPDFPGRAQALKNGLERLQAGEPATWPEGAFWGEGPPEGALAFLYPGQGAPRPNMFRDLAATFPQVSESLELITATAEADCPELADLGALIYPVAPTGQVAEALRAAAPAQGALAALEMGLTDLLAFFGLRPSAVLGHSFGELAAAWSTGVFSRRDFARAALKRGTLLGRAVADGRAAGGMLAVKADYRSTEELLASQNFKLTPANLNSPEQTVYSGRIEDIEGARAFFKAKKIQAMRLNVAGAYHQPELSSVGREWGDFLLKLNLKAPDDNVAWHTASSGGRAPVAPAEIADCLARGLSETVLFYEALESIYEAGARTFLEVGPGKILTGLLAKTLGKRPFQALALDPGPGDSSPAGWPLALVLSQLASWGHNVDLTRWGPDAKPISTADGFTVELTGANVFNPPPERPVRIIKKEAGAVLVDKPKQSGPHNDRWRDLMELGRETAKLHQQFLDNQTEALHLMRHMLLGEAGGQAAGPGPEAVIKPQAVQSPKALAGGAAGPPTFPATVAPAGRPGEQAAGHKRVEGLVFKIVARETGYPEEMLSPKMDLENDLGLDSIKKVEIMAALGEQLPQASGLTTDELNQARTLGDLAELLAQTDEPGPVSPPLQIQNPAPPAAKAESTSAVILQVIGRETGYPAEMLNPKMDLENDLGLDSIKKVEIMAALGEQLPQASGLTTDELNQARTLGDLAELLERTGGKNSAAPVPAQAQPSAPATEPAEGAGRRGLIIEVLARETGYPAEMLNPKMDLENDLGLDSIKKVEIMAALGEQLPQASGLTTDELNQARTLGDLIELFGHVSAAPPDPEPAEAASKPVSDSAASVSEAVLRIVARETGYPPQMLNLDMDMENDLGLDSIKKVETMAALAEELPGTAGLAASLLNQARTLKDLVALLLTDPEKTLAISESPAVTEALAKTSLWALTAAPGPALAAQTSQESLRDLSLWLAAEPGEPLTLAVLESLEKNGANVTSVDLTAAKMPNLETAPPPEGLIFISPPAPGENLALSAFKILKSAGALRPRLNRLLAVTRLGGAFAINHKPLAESSEQKGEISPYGAALAGLVKSAAREWPGLQAKVVDLPAEISKPDSWADEILKEFLCKDELIEVGRPDAKQRLTPKLTPYEPPGGPAEPLLEPGRLMVVTGGARGVTAASVLELARAYRPRLLILGRTPLPPPEPAWLAALAGAPEIKSALLNFDASLTPKNLAAKVNAILTGREMVENLRRFEEAGALVEYQAVDSRDELALTLALKQARNAHGPVTALIHGAGVLADSLIGAKTSEQFHQVFSTKVSSLSLMLNLLKDDPLKLIVLFSSSTARFGRQGQSDYAAANEVLNKIAQLEAERRPKATVMSVGWGPWAGGMVNAGLAKMFRREGLGLIPLKDGARLLASLSRRGPQEPVELVVLGPDTRIDGLNLHVL